MSYSDAFHNQDGATKAAIYDNMHDHMDNELSKEKKHIDPEYIDIDQSNDKKASDLWDIPSEAYDAAEQLLQEQETGGKKEDQDNQPLIMVEALNFYNDLIEKKFPPALIVLNMIEHFHITRK